jgi:CRP-like cAMP-binding protein
VSTPAGAEATLTLVGPGEIFGELALVRPERRRTATVIALDHVETLVITRMEFDTIRSSYPTVNRLLIDLLADRVDRLTRHLVEALYVGVEQRVIRRLLDAAQLFGGGRPGTIVPLTQEDLAGLAGAARPTVNQVLRGLQADGAVLLARGRIQVLQPTLLRQFADQ